MSSKDSDAYIKNIVIFDNNDDAHPELDFQIKRSFNYNNSWTFNIANQTFETDDIYLFVGVIGFDLSADATDIRIFNYKDILTIYVNDKDLKNKVMDRKELFYLSNEQLRLLRNALCAIHGYYFKSKTCRIIFQNTGGIKPIQISPNLISTKSSGRASS